MDIYFIDLNCDKIFLKNKIFLNKIHHKISRLFLNLILETKYGIISPEILTKNKKPYLKNYPLHFSISHSNSIVGIAFERCNIGFDIEYIKERNIKGLLKHYGLEKENISKEEFYQMWTVYEAEYKSGKQTKLISFYYNNYMCSVSCENVNINEIMEIKIINSDLMNYDMSEFNHKLRTSDFSETMLNNINFLTELKIKINRV